MRGLYSGFGAETPQESIIFSAPRAPADRGWSFRILTEDGSCTLVGDVTVTEHRRQSNTDSPTTQLGLTFDGVCDEGHPEAPVRGELRWNVES